MTYLHKILAALGFLGVGGSTMAFLEGGNAGAQVAAWVAALFLGAILIVIFLAKREAARIFGRIDSLPDGLWFKRIEDDIAEVTKACGRIPPLSWFQAVDHSIEDGRGFREDMQRRVGRLEGRAEVSGRPGV